MKKIILITLALIPLTIFSQFGYNTAEKFTYKSDGKHQYIGYNDGILQSSVKKNAVKYFNRFAKTNNLEYKILDEKFDIEIDPNGILDTSTRYKYSANIEFRDKNGDLFLTKAENNEQRNDAIKKLKQLKELLDMGLIDKSEFDSSAADLKKIILKN